MLTIWKRLVRNPARSVDRAGADQISPGRIHDPLWPITQEHTPLRTHDRGVNFVRGSIPSPQNIIPPIPLPSSDDVTVQVAAGGRFRHGEGLWGIEPLIPEGETL